MLRGSSDGGALSVWLEAKDAGDSFAQVQRSGLGAQDSGMLMGWKLPKESPGVSSQQQREGKLHVSSTSAKPMAVARGWELESWLLFLCGI